MAEAKNTSEGPKNSRWLHVAANLVTAYINLSEGDQEYAESYLANQVYSDAAMAHHTPGRAAASGCPDFLVVG